jgi:hypothetical protein
MECDFSDSFIGGTGGKIGFGHLSWVQIQILPLGSDMSLSKLLNLSELFESIK